MTFSWWQDWLRRIRNPLAGLSWFSRCSNGNPILVSRHYPHLLCWSWALEVGKLGAIYGSDHDGGVHLRRHNNGGYLVVWRLWLRWQNYRMVALRLAHREGASRE